MKNLLFFIISLVLFSCTANTTEEIRVSNQEELDKSIKESKPGDVIVMKNGIWKDVEIKFKAVGERDKPIILKAETPGEVFIEGQSYLKIAGHFLEVHNLYFRNGYTPINSVIQFKNDKDNAAFDCKVIGCVIENFTQLDRSKKDHWVEFWGQRNELRSCYIAGKSNDGPTIRAQLKGNEHANCYHVIANNYFGPRPRCGGPRGETMQLGDSYTSMVPAFIQVKNNFLDRCNGEVEVISSKSNYNNFSHNVFYKCEGSLVLRHGNYATVDSNWFIGDDNSENIGGVRVVNTGHWITNNYFYKLKGDEFRSALAVMNGIPKSPLNRYNQVTDVVIAHNSWIDCVTPLQFSVGSNVSKQDILPKSEIRSALPIRTTLANNLIYYSKDVEKEIVKYYDTPGDIHFKNNYVHGAEVKVDGFTKSEMKVVNDHLEVPLVAMGEEAVLFDGFDFDKITKDIFSNERKPNRVGAICSNASEIANLFDLNMYGPSWFSLNKVKVKGKSINVTSENEFLTALNEANAGDTIMIATDLIKFNQSVRLGKSICIQSTSENKVANIRFEAGDYVSAFELGPNVDLRMNHLSVQGNVSLHLITPDKDNMSVASNVFIDHCKISDFKSVYHSIKGSFADTIKVVHSSMSDLVNGIVVNSQNDAKGDYNAEFVILENNQVTGVQNDFVDYYRGGYDESTIGGNFVFKGNHVAYSGKKGKDQILLKTHGIVHVTINDNTFKSIRSALIAKLWGEKNNEEAGNTITGSSKIITEEFLTQKLLY